MLKRLLFKGKIGFRTLTHKTHHQGSLKIHHFVLARLAKNGGALIFEFLKQVLDLIKIGIIQSNPVTPGQIKGNRSREKSEGGSHAGKRRNEDSRRTDLFGEAIGMHRTGAAESGNCDNIGVSAFFRNMGFGRRRHGFID